jgi:siroheme synthase
MTGRGRRCPAPLAKMVDVASTLDPPTLVVVGDVVALAARLAAHEALGAAAA